MRRLDPRFGTAGWWASAIRPTPTGHLHATGSDRGFRVETRRRVVEDPMRCMRLGHLVMVGTTEPQLGPRKRVLRSSHHLRDLPSTSDFVVVQPLHTTFQAPGLDDAERRVIGRLLWIALGNSAASRQPR